MNAKWLWPRRGVPIEEVKIRMNAALKQSVSYAKDPVLGFPGTTPLPDVLRVHYEIAGNQPNNIGYHTGPKQAEHGFDGTQELERRFIYTIANLMGASDPESEMDGYVCMGGTEGNDHGLWLGRNMLRSGPTTSASNGIAVLTSFLSHYSIDKHFGRLFDQRPGNIDADLLQELPTDNAGGLDPRVVEEWVRKLNRQGYSRFLFVLTVGTTNMGSVDPVAEICNTLQALRNELHVNTYVHVDAAFGGFVLPFLEPDTQFGFQNQLVDSMVIDAHKMGYVPYPAGIFLCRKDRMMRYTNTPARYIPGHSCTVCGSRPGANAAACWALTQLKGQDDFQEDIQKCLVGLGYLKRRLSKLNSDGQIRVQFYPTRMNIQAVWVDEDIRQALGDPEDRSSLLSTFCIPNDLFPADLTNPTWEGNVIVRDVPVIRFTAMPHYDEHKIDQFMDELLARMPQPVR